MHGMDLRKCGWRMIRGIGGTKGGIRKPSGKGSRLIILHAGSENG